MSGLEFVSATFKDDAGGLVVVSGDQAVTPPPVPGIEYDERGFSVNGLFNVAWRIREIDEFANQLARGDEFQQAAAAKIRQYASHFALILPWREQFAQANGENSDEWKLVHFNRPQQLQFVSGWLGETQFRPFYPDTTEEVVVALTSEEQPARGVLYLGIVTPILGFDPNDDWEGTVSAYKNIIGRGIVSARNKALAEARGGIAPTVGPTPG